MEDNEGKYPEGHFVARWMAIGMAIFSGLGVALSTIMDSPGLMGIGPAIGVAFGAAVGQSIESKYKKEGKIRPLTDDEKKRRRIAAIAGVAVLVLGVLAFFLILFLPRL